MEPLTLAQLEALSRHEMHDVGAKPRTSQALIYLFAAEAENEACIRAKLLREEDNDSLVLINFSADQRTVDLSTTIFEVESVRIEADGRELRVIREDQLDDDDRYRTKSGSPERWYTSITPGGRLRLGLYPTPAEAVSVRLVAYRKPILPMSDAAHEPEIAPDYHIDLVPWIVHRCLSSRDPDIYDTSADIYLKRFVARFGIREDANTWRKHRHRTNQTTTPRDF